MFTRPITAIFVHPHDRYYVIYDNGERHKLNRMKLDKSAWQRKQPYTGSDDDIFLLKNQYIADVELAQQLTTYDWPDSLKGRSLKFFLSWWEKQAYHWLLKHKPHNHTDNAQNQPIKKTSADDNSTTAQLDKESSITDNKEAKNSIVTAQTAKQPIIESAKQATIQQIDPAAMARSVKQPSINKADTNTTENNATDNLFDDMLNELSEEISNKL